MAALKPLSETLNVTGSPPLRATALTTSVVPRFRASVVAAGKLTGANLHRSRCTVQELRISRSCRSLPVEPWRQMVRWQMGYLMGSPVSPEPPTLAPPGQRGGAFLRDAVMECSPSTGLRPATVVVRDFFRPADLQPDAETSAHAAIPRQLTFHVSYGGSADPRSVLWTAVCADVAGFVAEGTQLGYAEIGAAIVDQLAEFRDPQP